MCVFPGEFHATVSAEIKKKKKQFPSTKCHCQMFFHPISSLYIDKGIHQKVIK